MRSYNLFLSDDETKRLLISLPQSISGLSYPLSLSREKNDDDLEFENKFKKKSEIIEHISEDYKEIKDREREPFILSDSEQKMFVGRLQDTKTSDVGADDGCYFVFVNVGDNFSVVPVGEWYRFTHKSTFEPLSLEEAEQKLSKTKMEDKWFTQKKREKREDKDFDFEERFDDDEAEDEINFLNDEEKELDNAGEELKKIVKNYEKESSEEEVTERDKKKDKNELDDDKIRACFIKIPISVKDFLNEIKRKYNIEGRNKEMIREFIKRECEHDKDGVTKDKILYLKKK